MAMQVFTRTPTGLGLLPWAKDLYARNINPVYVAIARAHGPYIGLSSGAKLAFLRTPTGLAILREIGFDNPNQLLATWGMGTSMLFAQREARKVGPFWTTVFEKVVPLTIVAAGAVVAAPLLPAISPGIITPVVAVAKKIAPLVLPTPGAPPTTTLAPFETTPTFELPTTVAYGEPSPITMPLVIGAGIVALALVFGARR